MYIDHLFSHLYVLYQPGNTRLPFLDYPAFHSLKTLNNRVIKEDQALEAGTRGFINKPMVKSEIAGMIRQVLASSRDANKTISS
ncbi:hypothetical protein [Desulfosediminicola flagellatus]|uniref:hypothetical protein n=1 Tax=Desulfosediminicola flagellatus TaxID=2569541 RepID=UPI0010ACA490|nr:hypothetical protein [Desulfosediminicola flagellatus]